MMWVFYCEEHNSFHRVECEGMSHEMAEKVTYLFSTLKNPWEVVVWGQLEWICSERMSSDWSRVSDWLYIYILNELSESDFERMGSELGRVLYQEAYNRDLEVLDRQSPLVAHYPVFKARYEAKWGKL